MNLNLLTYSIVKTELGLTDDTQQAAIEAMIPKTSNDVRRILNTNYDKYIEASYSNGSTDITVNDNYENLMFTIGQVITGSGIPDNTYITAYDPTTGKYTMSASATSDGNYVYPTIMISQWSAISKMIWYRISNLDTSTGGSSADLKSISYGPVTKTYKDSEINTKWNYPISLIRDLGTPYAKVGF